MASRSSPYLIDGADYQMSRYAGYIGGSVLSRLLSHPGANTFDIIAMVRSHEKAKKLEGFGIKAVVGSFKTDLALVESIVEGSDRRAHV